MHNVIQWNQLKNVCRRHWLSISRTFLKFGFLVPLVMRVKRVEKNWPQSKMMSFTILRLEQDNEQTHSQIHCWFYYLCELTTRGKIVHSQRYQNQPGNVTCMASLTLRCLKFGCSLCRRVRKSEKQAKVLLNNTVTCKFYYLYKFCSLRMRPISV